MTLFYILGIVLIAFLSLRSIIKSLKKGEISYEYSKEEMRANADYNDYAFGSRK
jgi:hypothetical protein